MSALPSRADLWELPAWLGVGVAVLLAGLWIWLHLKPLQKPWHQLLRGVVAILASWATVQALGHWCTLLVPWPLFLFAVLSGGVLEAQAYLQRASGGTRLRCGLRLIAASLLLAMLLQPVLRRTTEESRDRHVLILFDESASMQLSDADRPADELIGLAIQNGVPLPPGRSQWSALTTEAAQLEAALSQTSTTLLESPLPATSRAAQATLMRPHYALHSRFIKWANEVERTVSEEKESVQEAERTLMTRLESIWCVAARDHMNEYKQGIDQGDTDRMQRNAMSALRELRNGASLEQKCLEALDSAYLARLPEAMRETLIAPSKKSRSQQARGLLHSSREGPSLWARIQKDFKTREVRFAASPRGSGDAAPPETAWHHRTDIASALTGALEMLGTQDAAGVVLITDGRHTGAGTVDDAAASMGMRGVPIFPMLVGSRRGSKDAAFVTVTHPAALYLGDAVRVKAELRADGLTGQHCIVKLWHEDQVVQEQTQIPDHASYRTTVSLRHQPMTSGVHDYRVSIEPVGGEVLTDNNERRFRVSVSEDRINVLLVEERPRWEFRYLRNLFDARDKSIHLQYVLTQPDQLPEAPAVSPVAASASRPFGESLATALPRDAEEWKKFDVIILGDLPPTVLTDSVWQTILGCVRDRGAQLVMIAGERHMPARHGSPAAQQLMPVDLYESVPAPAEELFRFSPVKEHRDHQLFQQNESGVENVRTWESIPAMSWRHPIQRLKPGTELLAWAEPVLLDASRNAVRGPAPALGGDPTTLLLRQRERERSAPLVVSAQCGYGKVVLMLSDQSWRFRYGTGDTVHHQFWGQVIRWGAGGSFPSGGNMARMALSQLLVGPHESVELSAKLADASQRPIASADVSAEVWRGAALVSRHSLTYMPDSQGIYLTTLPPLLTPGDYRVLLTGPAIERLPSAADHPEQLLTVSPPDRSLEIAETSSDAATAARLAQLSGGMVMGPGKEDALFKMLGPPSKTVTVERDISLWAHWGVWLAIALALGMEWVGRRRSHLP